MKEKNYELIDLDTIFTNELIKMMKEYKLDAPYCTSKDVHETIKRATSISKECHDELILWALYGDDKKAKTLGLVQILLKFKNKIYY